MDLLLYLSAAFTVGLLGSAHCVGMCGGLVVALHHGRPHPARRQALYLLGKTGAYAALGAAAGGLGALAGLAFAGAQGVVSGVLGAALVVGGLATCGLWRSPTPGMGGAFGFLARPIGRLVASDRTSAVVGLGALNGLLPCGLVYAMMAHAVTLGSATVGALSLAAFGAGTAPALVAVGTLGSRIPVRKRAWMQRAAGALVVALGVLTLVRGGVALDAGALLQGSAPDGPVAPLCLPGG